MKTPDRLDAPAERLGPPWWVVPLASLVAVAACFLGCAFVIVAPYATTRYAPGYSENAYWSIRPGDSKADVLSKLGEPFFRYEHPVEEQWDFTVSAVGKPVDKLSRLVAFEPASGRVQYLVADQWTDFFD